MLLLNIIFKSSRKVTLKIAGETYHKVIVENDILVYFCNSNWEMVFKINGFEQRDNIGAQFYE